MPSPEEKVRVYERLLHDLYFASEVEMNGDKVRDLLGRISRWSYSHRVGNGEFSEEEQNEIIERAFRKLSPD